MFSGLCFFASHNGGGWNVWLEIMRTDWSALNECHDSFCEKPIWNVFIILQKNFSYKILPRIQWFITSWTPVKFGFQNRCSHYETAHMNFSDLFPTLECICKCKILNSMFHLIQLNSHIVIVGSNVTPSLVLLKLVKLSVDYSTWSKLFSPWCNAEEKSLFRMYTFHCTLLNVHFSLYTFQCTLFTYISLNCFEKQW